jgi:hypothetical protein
MARCAGKVKSRWEHCSNTLQVLYWKICPGFTHFWAGDTNKSRCPRELWTHAGCISCALLQTGAGKTFTLSSIKPDAIGMIPRAAAEIFSAISQDTVHEYSVSLSYIQIYMELIQASKGAAGEAEQHSSAALVVVVV